MVACRYGIFYSRVQLDISLVSYRVKHSKRNSISTAHVLFSIYYINRGVIQGFPALRKAATTHVEKYRFFFFTCVDVAHQLLTRHSPLAPLGQVDFHDSQYKLFVRAFSNYGD